MTFHQSNFKKWIIGAYVVGISMLHFFPLPGWMGTHLLHRELYFFPILLAGFWFGLMGGLMTATGVSMVYAFQFAVTGMFADVITAVMFQVLVFLAVGLLLGWMVDRQERRRNERDIINDAFGRYVPLVVRDEILSGRIPLDGEFKHVTILFADLRNFTGLVENSDPRTVVRMMNRYFKEMTEAIRSHGGLVLQFIGDEIEAVFGAPVSADNHACMALQAALEMRARLESLNKELAQEGLPTLHHGVGIHTGSVLAGNIGSPERLSYAMVGTTVNLASRVQEANKQFGSDILITASTQSALGEGFDLTRLRPIIVKGYSKPIELYRLASSAMLAAAADGEVSEPNTGTASCTWGGEAVSSL